MNRHFASAKDNDEALDYTATPKRSPRDYTTESPILDLSVKKPNASTCSMSPVSIEAISSPPSIENIAEDSSRDHEDHYDEVDRKSPFETRNFMVTPPSEADSPRKPKYDVYLNDTLTGVASNSSGEMPNHRYAMLPTNLALPSVHAAAILSNMKMQQNNACDAAPAMLQLPVSTTPTPSVHGGETTCSISTQETLKKAPRPFKAYPKDPLSMSVGAAEMMYDQTSTEAYSEFRKRMLDSVRKTNEGTNIKMRRVSKSPGLPTSTMMDEKDAAYWERRRKNNEAAKRSRDARRAKEDEIAIRAAFLEQENMKLKYELVALRNETAKLRCMVYSN